MRDNLIRLEDRESDAQLVQRARAGAATAKRALFERHVAMASAVAFRLTGHENDVEDIVQDSFVAAFEALGSLAEPKAFRGWLASIVTRTAIATIRKRRLLRRLGLLPREPVYVDALVGRSAPPDVVAELRGIYAVVDELPAEERAVYILRKLEQLQLAQIAEQTGASLATVKRRLARAEKRIERALGEAGAKS